MHFKSWLIQLGEELHEPPGFQQLLRNIYCIVFHMSILYLEFFVQTFREKTDIMKMFMREHRKLRKNDRKNVFLIGTEPRLCIQISIQTRVSCYYTWSPWAQEQLIACWFNIYKHKNRSAVSSVITTSWSHSCWGRCYKWSNSYLISTLIPTVINYILNKWYDYGQV